MGCNLTNNEYIEKEIRNNLYRLLPSEMYADIYSLSMTPYINNLLADKYVHISKIYLSDPKNGSVKVDVLKKFISNYYNLKETNTLYDLSFYEGIDLDKYNRDVMNIDKIYIEPYLTELVGEGNIDIGKCIIKYIATLSITSNHFTSDLHPIDIIVYINKWTLHRYDNIFSNWIEIPFLIYGMSEFPKIWEELIKNNII